MSPDAGEEREIAWLATPLKAPVVDEAGAEIGQTERLLGDEAAEIFHGIVVRLNRSGQRVEVPADRIPKITTRRVYTDLAANELETLPPHKSP